MKIIRKQLYALEGLPAWQRWNPLTETFEQSFDDGQSWVSAPAADPRVNPGGLAPVNTRPDPRCAAAAGMRGRFEEIMEQFWLADSLIQAANAVLLAITLFNPPAALLWRVISAICTAIYSLGSAALLSAFGGDTFDRLQCVFWRNISNDGIMNDAQLSDVNTEICADFDVTVCAASGLMLNMLGSVGMSNAGALYAADSDCDDCGCDPATCVDFNFSAGQQGFYLHTWSGDQFTGGEYYTGGGFFPNGWGVTTTNGFNRIGIEAECDCINANACRVTTFTPAGASIQISVRISRRVDNFQLALKNFYVNPTGTGSGSHQSTWDIGGLINERDVDIEIGVTGTSGYGLVITRLELLVL